MAELNDARCGTCTSTQFCPIPFDGPVDAKVMCLGERPGASEEIRMFEAIEAGGALPERICFVGMAGREFNDNYLHLAGLRRDLVRVGNTVRCGAALNRTPTTNEALNCAGWFLPAELEMTRPEVLILMGATACKLVEGVDLEADHGIPRRAQVFGWEGWVVPMYHPAAGLHNTAMMIPMLADWETLRAWLEDDRWMWPTDEWAGKRDYGLIETVVEAEEFIHRCCRLPEPFLIGGDTETHAGTPYSWQLNFEPGVARMIMLANESVCESLSCWLAAQTVFGNAGYVFHNAPADLPIFERLLHGSLDGRYRDTMQEAYGFGNMRLGLKSLAKRLLGRSRLSWDETVTPWSKQVLGAWLSSGFVHAESQWRTVTERFHKKTNKPLKPTVTRSEAEKLLVELNGYMLNNPEYKIWDKLRERMPEAELSRLVTEVGEVPSKGIAHCPMDVQIEYACSDPDDTRQLALLFDQMREEFTAALNIQDEDRDVIQGY